MIATATPNTASRTAASATAPSNGQAKNGQIRPGRPSTSPVKPSPSTPGQITAKSAQSPCVEPRVERMLITPTQAVNWLDNANIRNRTVSQAAVERYARDMRAGHWRLTHEGIAFDPNGVLLDGQHRLWAVVYAEMPVEMHVWFNVATDSLMVIGGGRGRNLVDHLRLGGGLGDVNKDVLAVLRCLLGKGSSSHLTPDEAREVLRRHERPIMFAMRSLPPMPSTRGIATCETRAVIARAWYSASEERLTEFCEVLRSSMARRDADKTVVLLRNYLIGGAGWERCNRRERYAKIERTLLAFLRDESVSRLNAATKELFPLPEEATEETK